ncbi:hypothetical protein LJ754_03690 [Arthrobacter sp. zg-Y40]|uniref:hypothetical protein n=1 Tax=Arthrobacter sp. zg-Y40 TaxID=2886939 RepID=UPI001D139ECD|nr:hypothetical protein [Arthrobacter sp. zg-Y40]MCC3278260.1 hypothetical protein [Arthrobacter sp. zg-Y40]
MRPHHLFFVSAGTFAAAWLVLSYCNAPRFGPAVVAVIVVLTLWTCGYVLNNRRAARAAGIRLQGRRADRQVLVNRSPAQFAELLDTVFGAVGLYYRGIQEVPGGVFTRARNRTVLASEPLFVVSAPGPDGGTLVRVAAEHPKGTLNWGEASRQVRLLLGELSKWDAYVRDNAKADPLPWPHAPLELKPLPAGYSELALPAEYPEPLADEEDWGLDEEDSPQNKPFRASVHKSQPK